jgi:hypothetical protein
MLSFRVIEKEMDRLNPREEEVDLSMSDMGEDEG